jgi:hypothetical protein
MEQTRLVCACSCICILSETPRCFLQGDETLSLLCRGSAPPGVGLHLQAVVGMWGDVVGTLEGLGKGVEVGIPTCNGALLGVWKGDTDVVVHVHEAPKDSSRECALSARLLVQHQNKDCGS